MKSLLKFFIIWYSQNMAIPFWVIGHVHLSLNVYDDWKEITASTVMQLMVLVGFIIDYRTNGRKDD